MDPKWEPRNMMVLLWEKTKKKKRIRKKADKIGHNCVNEGIWSEWTIALHVRVPTLHYRLHYLTT